jgi:TonB family protein
VLVSVLMAAAALATATPEPHLGKAPGWLKKPTDADLFAVYPHDALIKGVAGNVVLSCMLNTRGGMENCQIVSETPPDQGFGAAAMALLPQMSMRPGEDASGPVQSEVRIPLHFMTSPGVQNDPPSMVRMILSPVFVAAPSFEDVGAAYYGPGGGPVSKVSVRCRVKKTGELKGCMSLTASISGDNFRQSAMRLATKFRLQVDPAWNNNKVEYGVDFPILVQSPASPAIRDRLISEPRWLQGPDPAAVVRLFPAQAAAKGVKTGRGVAVCTVSADGSLVDCAPGTADPDGLGFSEAAVQVAKVMKMNLWTQEGGPVIGARFQLPIRFNLAAPAAGAVPPASSK